MQLFVHVYDVITNDRGIKENHGWQASTILTLFGGDFWRTSSKNAKLADKIPRLFTKTMWMLLFSGPTMFFFSL